MNMDTVVQCVCGHRIGLNELLAHGFVMVGDEPVHVYIKYRCAECGYEGLELLDYDRWNAMIKEPEPDSDEVTDLKRLGPIDPGEILQFARGLANVTDTQFAALHSNTA